MVLFACFRWQIFDDDDDDHDISKPNTVGTNQKKIAKSLGVQLTYEQIQATVFL